MKPIPCRNQRGVSLIDGLIAIAILSFGLIGLSRMQGRMVTAATDAQFRTNAVQLADELLNTALVDSDNAPCYTLPTASAGCTSAAASTAAAAWAARVAQSMPGTVTSTVDLTTTGGTRRMSVNIGWTPRDLPEDQRALTMWTDV